MARGESQPRREIGGRGRSRAGPSSRPARSRARGRGGGGPRGCGRRRSRRASRGDAFVMSRPSTRIVAARAARRMPAMRLDQLGLPVAVDAGDADDLARAHVAARGRARRRGRGRRARAGPATCEHRVLGRGRRRARPAAAPRGPTISSARPCFVAPLAVDRRDLLAAPQHGDAVGDRQHLVELVRDDDDRGAARPAARAAPRRARCASCGVSTAVGSSRISTLRVAVERLEDLDALLLPDADVLDAGVRRARRGRSLRESSRTRSAGAGQVEQRRRLRGSAAEHDVLGHRHHRDQHEVLVHHADAERRWRRPSDVKRDRLARRARISPSSGR